MKKIDQILKALFNYSIISYKKVWAITSLIIVLAIYFAVDIKFLVMMSDLLDSDFETYSEYHELNENFTEENQVSVMIGSTRGELTYEQHCKIIRWLGHVHLNNYRVEKIFSSYGYREGVEKGKRFQVKPILIPDCQEENTALEIKSQFKRLAETPSGVILTSKKRDDIFASFYLRNLPKGKGNNFGHFDKKAFETLRDSFHKKIAENDPSLKATWIGIGTYQYFLQKAYEHMNIVNLITGLLILLSFKFLFGRWKSGVFLLSTYTLATIILYGFMSFMRYPVDSLSAAVPIMLLVSTLEDFVFFLFLYEKNKNIKESFEKIIVPSFFTSLTTCFGFLSLTLSDLSIIQRFGVVCAFGALLEWIIVFLILPKFLLLFEKRSNGLDIIAVPKKVTNFVDILSKVKMPKAFGLIAIVPFLYLLLTNDRSLTIDDSPEAIFPNSHPVVQSTDILLEKRGWKSEISLVFPEIIEREKQNEIASTIVKAIPEFVAYESYQDVKKHMVRNIEDIAYARYIQNNLDDSNAAKRWLAPDSRHERILIYSSTTDVVRINEIRKKVKSLCEGDCYLANILISYSEFGTKILRTLTSSFSVSLAIVITLILILSYVFRLNQKLLILFTAIWGPFTLISLFLVLDIGIYFATSVVMSVLVGLAGDNALHFIFANGKEKNLNQGVQRLEKASILTMIAMILTSIGFLFSEFEGVRKIGLIMMSGFFIGWVGDLIILKSFLRRST